MQELRQSTGVTVRIGPAVDATDGVTPETTLALGAADQAELLKHDGAATVDISGRTFAAVTGCDGWYDLTLTTADVDTLGVLEVVIQDASLCAPIFVRFMVVGQAYYDGKYGSAGLPANVIAHGGRLFETGTAQAGTVNTITLAAVATSDDIAGGWIFLVSGTGAGQGAMIDAYDGGTKVATLSKSLTTAPDATTGYFIIPHGFNVVSDANPIEATVTEVQAAAVTEIWAKVCESEGSITAQQILSILLSSGAGTTSNGGANFHTPNGNAQRVAGTMNASNERTAITLTPSA
ncbi:MAG: hypothetical protein AB2806_08900 [Candidatus Thiodiazotropha sp.]